jgi:hypothetical protein
MTEEWGVVTAEQVAQVVFKDAPFPLRQAQHRLQRLHETRRIKRTRLEAFAYYLEKPHLLEHRLGLNTVRIWSRGRLKAWESMEWTYEPPMETIRPDAFVEIRNRFTGESSFGFVEMERAGNDKVGPYVEFYQKGLYLGFEWAKRAKRFPSILIVTEGRKVDLSKAEGLRFEVKELEEIRKECATCQSSGLPSKAR